MTHPAIFMKPSLMLKLQKDDLEESFEMKDFWDSRMAR